MLYMSNQPFNAFLVNKLLLWLSSEIKKGEKFRFFSYNEYNLQALYEAMLHITNGEIDFHVSSLNQVETFSIPYIAFENCKLLIVTDIETKNSMNPGFISNLRDSLVDFEEAVALFVVLKSDIDTLLSTTKEVSLQGRPLNPQIVEQDLKKLLNDSGNKKDIYSHLLTRQTKIIDEEQESAFAYSAIYNSIVSNTIDFKHFNLFPDPALLNSDDINIEKRINENDKYFRNVEKVIREYPNEINEKLPDLSPKFINKNFNHDEKNDEEKWKETLYIDILTEIDNNKVQNVVFDEKSMIYNVNDIIRTNSDTAAGKRNQNIIIETDETNLTLNFTFSGNTIRKDQFTISHNNVLEKSYEIEILQKKTAQLSFTYSCSPTYFTLTFRGGKSSEKFTFKVLVLKKSTFYLEDIRRKFIVNPGKNKLIIQTEEFIFRFHPDENTSRTVLQNGKTDIDITTYHTIDIEQYYNQHDDVKFSIYNGEARLDLQIEGNREEEIISIPFLFDSTKSNRLFNSNKDIEFNSAKNKAIIDNREKKLNFERLDFVRREYEIIERNYVSPQLTLEKLKTIDEDIYNSYNQLLEYFKTNKTTPSLAAWNDSLCKTGQAYIDSFLEYCKRIQPDSPLSESDKYLFELGFTMHNGNLMMSPFSPLIIAYVVQLVDHAKSDNTYTLLPDITLDRLNPKGLFPYRFIDSETFAFTQVSRHNSLWLEFVPHEENEFKYVKDLTKEKIVEFIDSFKELFTFRRDAPLLISSINNHSNKELFEGIVDYYKDNFSNGPVKMVVNLFDDSYTQTEFDNFSDSDKYDLLKEKYKLREDAESIIDTIRTHLTYSKHLTSENQGYAHLSFFKNVEKVVIKSRTFDQSKSGLVSSGLISGESSQKEKDTYYSGFGLRNVDPKHNTLLQIAQTYNALQWPVYDKGTNYEPHKTVSLMISDRFKQDLKNSYNNALWTVIIDPKVTLEFFHNEENLILIHYSDQYSSSANYDAITVTAQKELYTNVILPDHDADEKEKIVTQFNAFNGEWLIKMITANENTKKQHISTIATYKYITALLDHENYTWVPLSVGEMIRVSGNIGLPMSQSDFSRYNAKGLDDITKAGPISDDILLFGFNEHEVILYPVEVKSSSADISKAIIQAKKLKYYFYDNLFQGSSLRTKLLKGLFIRQVFMQIEKYELYNTFKPDYFKPLHDNREFLLEGTFTLKKLENHSAGAVVAFLSDQHRGKFETTDEEILVIRLPYIYQEKMLGLSFGDIQQELHNGGFDTNNKYFLRSSKSTVIQTSEQYVAKVAEQEKPLSEPVVTKGPQLTDKANETRKPLEIEFGTSTLRQEKIFWHPTNTIENQNTNTGIIGTMGTGKTQFTKSLITQLIHDSSNNVTGSKIDILIFDYKGDYIGEEFVKATGATVYELEKLPFNPLQLFGNKPKLPTHTGRTLTTTLSKAFNLGNVQKSILKNVIQDAYTEKGIDASDKDTWDLSAPTLEDVWNLYTARDDVKQDSLYAALDDLIDFEIFESDPAKTKSLYDVIDGVTVINLSGYDSNIQNLIVAIVLDLFYVQMHNHGSSVVQGDFRQISKIILVDEADNFMSQDFESLKKILKEGREFGVGTILSTQELTHFKTAEDNYANYIFTWIIHKVANIKSQDIQSIFNISSKAEAENLMSQVRELPKHQSFYVDGKKEITLMRDLAFWELLKGVK